MSYSFFALTYPQFSTCVINKYISGKNISFARQLQTAQVQQNFFYSRPWLSVKSNDAP